nr:division septum protein Blr [Enterobacter hormaechei]
MSLIINRIIELAGWIVLGVSVVLLGIASHIDNYQPPEPVTVAQQK